MYGMLCGGGVSLVLETLRSDVLTRQEINDLVSLQAGRVLRWRLVSSFLSRQNRSFILVKLHFPPLLN